MAKTDTGMAIKQLLKQAEPKIRYDLRLSRICTFGIGGTADAVIAPESETELLDIIRTLSAHQIPFVTVGAASDLLFSDLGFRGAVIRTSRLNKIFFENGKLYCQAGVPLSRLCSYAATNGLGGLHGLCGIPGTVGGALMTAAGAFGCNIYDCIRSCRVFIPSKNEIKDINCSPQDFSYRKSPLTHYGSGLDNAVILSAIFEPTKEENAVILRKIAECTKKRLQTQPHGERSAGSYFKRPQNAPPAAYLIEQAGLKGASLGGATVSEKHSGFIINRGDASAAEVLELASIVKKRVFDLFGVKLTEEVIFVGEVNRNA